MHCSRIVCSAFGLFLCFPTSFAQDVPSLKVSDLKFSVGVQLLGVYTTGAKAAINGDGVPKEVDDRFDTLLRRDRFGVSGTVWQTVDFLVALDRQPGAGSFHGAKSPPNEAGVTVRDAYRTWCANRKWANITAGLLRPRIGRQGVTSWSQTNSSMDKLPRAEVSRAIRWRDRLDHTTT